MSIVGILLLPLPTKIQDFLITNYNKLIYNSNFAIILSFIDVLVGIMFVDAFKNGFGLLNKTDEIIEFNKHIWDVRAKKFYNQRNLYILGAILALQVCIWFIIMLLKSTVKNKDKLVKLIKVDSSVTKEESNDQIELKDQLSKLETDVKILKKQYDSLWVEYQRKNETTTEKDDNKKDK